MAGTVWKDFVASTKVKAAEINQNFDWIEGALMPQTAGSMTAAVYDLGSSTYKWRGAYFGTSVYLGGKLISDLADSVTTFHDGSGAAGLKSSGINGSSANDGGTAGKFLLGSISKPDFRANAGTSVIQTEIASTLCATTIATVTITTRGGPVMLIGNASISITPGTAGSVTYNTGASVAGWEYARVEMSIRKDNTSNPAGGFAVAGVNIQLVASLPALMLAPKIVTLDTPAAGAHTYELRYNVVYGTNASVINYNFSAIEFAI